jgi:hypothetical protein
MLRLVTEASPHMSTQGNITPLICPWAFSHISHAGKQDELSTSQ